MELMLPQELAKLKQSWKNDKIKWGYCMLHATYEKVNAIKWFRSDLRFTTTGFEGGRKSLKNNVEGIACNFIQMGWIG